MHPTPQEPSSIAFHEPQWLELTDALLGRLRGRMSLIQPTEERTHLVASMLEELLATSDGHFPPVPPGPTRHQFIHAFLSYDLIEHLLNDPMIEDIIINATNPIFIHRTGEGLVTTPLRFPSSRAVDIFVKKLVIFAGRSEVDPINDVELMNVQGRANIIQSPFGPQITIARGRAKPFTILQLIDSGMLTYELAGQLWLYVEGLRVRPANVIISGGPGTGKTTLLNALLSFVPWQDRVVIIEDTLELNTTFLDHCSRLESCRRVRTPELVKNSLRMRPDRIIVGEVRGSEAHDLMTVMNIGKYGMGTVHASTAKETILRLQNEPMNVPPVLVNLVDVFVILRKLNKDGNVQRVVSELVETAGMEHQLVLLSTVWNYDPETRQVVERAPSSSYRDRLATESGRTPLQIMNESTMRARLLKAMAESQRFQTIAEVTALCQRYSEQPEEALRQLGTTMEKLATRR